MIAIAGGILAALFVISVIVGLIALVRDGFRFVRLHFATVALAAALGAWGLYAFWPADPHKTVVIVQGSQDAAKCVGQCEYR